MARICVSERSKFYQEQHWLSDYITAFSQLKDAQNQCSWCKCTEGIHFKTNNIKLTALQCRPAL